MSISPTTVFQPGWSSGFRLGRVLFGWLAATVVVGTAALAPAAPPANDMQASAQVLDGSLTAGGVLGTTVEATSELGEPDHASFAATHSVWYRFRPENGGIYTWDTLGTSLDTVLAIYEETNVTAPGLAANDDVSSTQTQSRIQVSLTTGTMYLIAVDSKVGTTGTFPLNWQLCVAGPLTQPLNLTPPVALSAQALIQWTGQASATDYLLEINATSALATADTQATVTLQPGLNQIRVTPRNACGTGPALLIEVSYCPPDTVTYLTPDDSQSFTLGEDVVLSWEPVPGATSYELLIDGELVTVPGTSISIRDITTPNPYQPTAAGLHDWGVRARFSSPSCGAPVVADRRYNVCNRTPVDFVPIPANGSQIPCEVSVRLAWATNIGSGDPVDITSYDLYLNGNLVQSGTNTQYIAGVLPPGTYTWEVVAQTNPATSCSVYRSGPWSFCVLANPIPLSPSSGSVQKCSLETLEWEFNCLSTATLVAVFVDGVYLGDTTGTQFRLPAPLSPGNHDWNVLTTGTCTSLLNPFPVSFCVQDSGGDLDALVPPDRAGLSTEPLFLEWTPGCGVTDYRVILNGVEIGRVTGTSIPLDRLTNPLVNIVPGINQWTVQPTGVCGPGDFSRTFEFDLCTTLSTPILNFPVGGVVVDSAGTSFYSWNPFPGALEYGVTVDGTFVTTTTDSFLPIGPNTCGTHTWQVDVLTACGSTQSTTETFCVLDQVRNTEPADQSTTHCAITELFWEPACGATTYSVELDGIVIGVTTDTKIALPGPLAPGSHTWIVTSIGECGTVDSVIDGLPFRFCVRDDPASVTALSPANGTVLSTGPSTLSWSSLCGVDRFAITLNGTFIGNTTGTTLAVPPGVAVAGPNVWEVEPRMVCGSASSMPPLFDFCVSEVPAITFPTSGTVAQCDGGLTVEYTLPPGATTGTLRFGPGFSTEVDLSSSISLTTLPVGCHLVTLESVTSCGLVVSDPVFVEVHPTLRFTGPSDPDADPRIPVNCGPQTLTWEPVCGLTTGSVYTVFLNGTEIAQTTATALDLGVLGVALYSVEIQVPAPCGGITSSFYNFCVTSGGSTAVQPATSSTVALPPTQLEWTGCPLNGAEYQVALNGIPVGTTTGTILAVDPLLTLPGLNTWTVTVDSPCSADVVSQFEYFYDITLCPPGDPLLISPTSGTLESCLPGGFRVDYLLPAGVTTATLVVDPLFSVEIDNSGTTDLVGIPAGCYNIRIEVPLVCGTRISDTAQVEVTSRLRIFSPADPSIDATALLPCGPKTLAWNPQCGATTGTTVTVFLNDVELGQTTSTSFFLGNLTSGGYLAEAVVPEACGGTTTFSVAFCVNTEVTTAVTPLEGAVLSTPPTVLEWLGCSDDSTSFVVSLNGTFVGETTGSSIAVDPRLTLVGANEWLVEATGPCGAPVSSRFTFTYDPLLCPTVPVILSPTSGTQVRCNFGGIRVDYELPVGVTTATLFVDPGFSVEIDDAGSTDILGLAPGCYDLRIEVPAVCGPRVSEVVRVEITSSLRIFSPADPSLDALAVLSCGPQTLRWNPVCGATTGTTVSVLLNGLELGQTTTTDFFLGSLTAGFYTAVVRTTEACGGTEDFSVNFCVRTDVTAAIQPALAAVLTTQPTILEWDACTDGITSTVVRLNGTLVGETTGTSIAVSPSLTVNGFNEWVVEIGSPCGLPAVGTFNYFYDTSGCPRPSAVSVVSPADDPVNPIACGLNTLAWASPTTGPVADSYEVYIDGVLQGVTTTTVWTLGSSLLGGPHSWEIVPQNACGAGTTSTFQFCLQNVPVLRFPRAGQIVDCTTSTEIRWDGSCSVGLFDVFVDGVLVGQTTGTSLTIPGPLALGSHTVQVILNGPCGVSAGSIETFCVQGTPVNVAPPDGLLAVVLPTELEWLPACGASTYTVVLNGSVIGQTTGTTFPITLTPGTGPFRWEIVAEGDCGPTTGPRWLFTDCGAVPPPDGPVPFDGETTASGLPTELRWNPVPGATSYQVRINGSFVTNVATNFYTLPFTLPDLTYTWQITAEVPSCGLLVPGPTWTFSVCTLLPAPLPITPFDGETTRPENIQFEWTDVPGVISYRMVLDNFVTGDLFSSNFSFGVGIGISPGVRQWAPVSRTSCGFTTAPLTTFCVLDWAVNPEPGNGTLLCDTPSVFRWNPVPSATRYDVLIDGVVVGTSVPLNQFTFTGTLAPGIHTWQVISYNICGQMASEIWTFEIGQSGVPSNLAWQTDGVVHALVTDGSRMYIGGEFEHLVSPTGAVLVPRRNIAAVDLTTGQPADWNPGTDGPVFALVLGTDRVYAGGDFTLFGNAIQNRVGAVAKDRGLPVPFNSSVAPNQVVRALALSPDESVLYLGGDFNRVGTTVRRYLAGVSTSGGGLTAFNPDANNRVRALLTDPSGDLFVGGIFNQVGTTPRNGLARLTSAGVVTPWNANCDLYVYALKRGTGGLFVGGFFTSIGGAPRTNLALLDLATGIALPWNPQVNGTVVTVEPDGDGVFVGGLFSKVGTTNRPYLARVSASTGVAGECGYDPDYPVRAISVRSGTVWVGGEFTLVGGRPMRGLVGFGQITPPPTEARAWELYD